MPTFAVAIVDRFDFQLTQKFVKAINWRRALQKVEHARNESTHNCPDMAKWIDNIPANRDDALRYYLDTDRTFSVIKNKRVQK